MILMVFPEMQRLANALAYLQDPMGRSIYGRMVYDF